MQFDYSKVLIKKTTLFRLQAAAASTINEWKEQSTAGLQYMLDTRGELEVDIHLIAPYFLVPQDGVLTE